MLENSDSIFDVYHEFNKIVTFNYSPERLCLMDAAAEKMFVDLDWEIAENLMNENISEFYDQENDEPWDFPDPPEFLQ